MPPVIALLTDFGLRDAYVGMVKGVILGLAPNAQLIDLGHQVSRHDVREAAFDLVASYRYFPADTVFYCVVDPGVGSSRRAMALRLSSADGKTYSFVCPDNGILSAVLAETFVLEVVSLENPHYQLSEVSSTFHGRDIFAPAAAYIAKGLSLSELGPQIMAENLLRLPWPKAQRTEQGWEAAVVHADQFGNLITNLHSNKLKPRLEDWQVRFGPIMIGRICRTFTDVNPGKPLAYVGSSSYLEIAVRDGSAQQVLALKPGSMVLVKLEPIKL